MVEAYMNYKYFIINYILSAVLILGLAIPSDTQAGKEDAFKNMNPCERYFTYFEKKNNIPPKLLHSVSLVESGKWDNSSQQLAPWPWTVNLKGKGHYFASKQEAVSFVKKQLKNGNKSMDLGCMQVNLKYHGQEFDNIAQIFEPRYNIEYAAELLGSKYKRLSNWKKAVGYYHSGTPTKGKKYAKKVYNTWEVLIAQTAQKSKQFDVASN